MGLDFHTAGIPSIEDLSFDERAHWSYSGFKRFRDRLPREPQLEPLLNHSDCDGELSPQECEKIIPALIAVIVDWPEDDYDKTEAFKLVRQMIASAQMNRALVFS